MFLFYLQKFLKLIFNIRLQILRLDSFYLNQLYG